MAERYSLRINETGHPAAYQDAPGWSDPVPRAIGGVADALDKVSIVARRKKEELDMVKVEDTLNRFVTWNLDYTNNPETGIFHDPRYQFGNAEGLSDIYAAASREKVSELSAGLTPEQETAFQRAALDRAMPFYRSAQDYESKQIVAYKDLQTQTTVDTRTQMALSDPLNEETMALAVRDIGAAVELKMMGAPDESVRLIAEAEASKLEAERIAIVAADDPILAQGMIEGSKYLLPDTKATLEARNKGAVTDYKARGIAGDVMERFGGEYDAAAGIAWIRKHVKEPELQDAAVTRYAGFMREKNMRYDLAREEENRIQAENAEKMAVDYGNGNPWSDDRINEEYENKNISGQTAEWALNRNATAAGYAETERNLKKEYGPVWDSLSPSEQDALLMRDTDPRARAETYDALAEGITSGGATEDDVRNAVKARLITRAEGEVFAAAIKGRDEKNKLYINDIKEKLKETMDPGRKSSILYGQVAPDSFEDGYRELEKYIIDLQAAKDPDIVAHAGVKAIAIQNRLIDEARLEGLDPEGMVTKDIPWVPQPFHIGPKEPSGYNLAVRKAAQDLEALVNQGANAGAVTIPPMKDIARVKTQEENLRLISRDILGGDFDLTSMFHSKRKGRPYHGGLDYGAPIGTPVRAPSVLGMGGEFTVTEVVSDRGGARTGDGNRVVISGFDHNGARAEWQFNHLSDVSVKAGDTVTPGMTLGKVGNTGSVIASKGGNGAHLDLKLKANGKLMDPARYYAAAQAEDKKDITGPASTSKPAVTMEDISKMSADERIVYGRKLLEEER